MRKSFPPRRNQAKFEKIVKEFSERAGVDFRAKIELLLVEKTFSKKSFAASGFENGDDWVFGRNPNSEHGKYNKSATLQGIFVEHPIIGVVLIEVLWSACPQRVELSHSVGRSFFCDRVHSS